jgi:methyl-accepting chemotaxis protein
MKWLASIPVSRKLLLIGIILLLPIAWLLWLAVRDMNYINAQTGLEIEGMYYCKPLVHLIWQLETHELLASQVAGGKKDLESERAAAENRVAEAIKEMIAVDRRIGGLFQFNEASLAQRKRTGATATEVERLWEDLRRRRPGLSRDAIITEHENIVARIGKMLTHLFETSALLTDFDVDSQYLAFTTVTHLPRFEHELGRALVVGVPALEEKTVPVTDRVELAEIYALANYFLDIGSTRVQASLNEDVNYYGLSASLQSRVPPALKQFESLAHAFLESVHKVVATDHAGVDPAAFQAAGRRLGDELLGFWDLLQEELIRLFEIRRAAVLQRNVLTLGLTLAALGIAFTLVGLVSRSMTRPLSDCARSLESLAAGDLTTRQASGGRDEIGRMTISLVKAVDGMSRTVRSIAVDSAKLSQSSGELASASQQMSSNAEETSTQAGVVSAAAEEVSKSVQSVSISTREMNASIREVAKQATDAARVATAGVKVAETTNTTVAKLGESSAEIGKVIKVITSIAEQTNLLALNATIEAARVGEAGKGFAVVANEVKELARETARATEDISRKIEAIQTDSRDVVRAISEIGAIINQINDIQGTIASAVEEQTLTTREIGRNLTEAADGAKEIARNIHGVADAAHNTSEGAHRTQTAARDLARMAADLAGLVARFKLD